MSKAIHSKTIHFSAQKQLRSAQKIFMREMFRSEDGFAALLRKRSKEDNEGLDTYKRLHLYFMHPAHQVLRFLDRWEQYPDEDETLTQYFTMMSLLQERVDTLIRTLDISKKALHRHFRSFEVIRCWANFVRYPKAFMYVPFPDYYMELNRDFIQEQCQPGDVIIDSDFVLQFYAGEELIPDEALNAILSSARNVRVEVPDLALLTSQICKAMRKLIEMLCSTADCAEILEEQKLFINQ